MTYESMKSRTCCSDRLHRYRNEVQNVLARLGDADRSTSAAASRRPAGRVSCPGAGPILMTSFSLIVSLVRALSVAGPGLPRANERAIGSVIGAADVSLAMRLK